MRRYPLSSRPRHDRHDRGLFVGRRRRSDLVGSPDHDDADQSETHTAAPGAIGVSPNGVTTAVGAAAESTEEEYFQACQAAKAWMDQQGGDPKSQIEPYLAMLQKPAPSGPGTYNTRGRSSRRPGRRP